MPRKKRGYDLKRVILILAIVVSVGIMLSIIGNVNNDSPTGFQVLSFLRSILSTP